MNCLTQSEIAQWLSAKSVTPAPYGSAHSPTFYLQFSVPNRPLSNAAFIRQFLKLTHGETLIHVTDWPTYEPSEMAIVDGLRHGQNESRHLIDSPGHQIPADKTELAVALFAHTVNFEWNPYLYLPNNLATMYNWEGELFDFWSSDEAVYCAVENLVSEFNLERKNAG